MRKILFEIGTEELPANYMPGILANMKDLAVKKLDEARIPYTSVKTLGTPRRLTLIVDGVEETQADKSEEFKGPSAEIAFKDGKPTKAAEGFARGKKVDVASLVVKDGYVYAVRQLKGEETAKMLPKLLDEYIRAIPFPNHMRWADFDFRFLRPIHWLCALFGKDVIPVSITDIASSDTTMGHRFLSEGEIKVEDPDSYEKVLEDHFVIVDQDRRREMIRKQVMEIAVKEGGTAEIADDLLEEVNYLVEYPTALCGNFEEKYLRLPEAAVVTPMRDHQRYFPVRGKDGKLMNKFITVRNGGSDFIENVVHGNERVLRARLSDAEFFFDEDRQKKLEGYEDKIKTVVFQEGLGSMYDKSQRLVAMVQGMHFELASKVSLDDLKRAARLCKCDLVTGMVTEFTELQGVIGKEYALLDGEKKEVAEGIYEHYLPRFAGDELPRTEIGRILGIADKVDNIVATFSRGLAPTGSQDPFALRRQALGIINILLDGKVHLDLMKVIAGDIVLLDVPKDKAAELAMKVMEFIRARLRNMLLDQGIRYDVVDSVLADERNTDIYDICLKARAMNDFVKSDKASGIVQAAVRVNNLSSKIEHETAINEALFATDAERELFKAVGETEKEILPALTRCEYAKALEASEGLVEKVNSFFDDVMVMDKDEKIRDNRLALLKAVKDLMNSSGDMSKLVL